MKRVLLSAIFLILLSSCGVKRPYPLSIQLINSNSGIAYSQQGSMAVITYSMYDVKISWDVSDTGAQGVEILAASGTDYYCSSPIATARYYITNSSLLDSTYTLDNLAQIFYTQLSKFKAGNYALCLRAVLYDSVSEPSLPVFMELRMDQQGGI